MMNAHVTVEKAQVWIIKVIMNVLYLAAAGSRCWHCEYWFTMLSHRHHHRTEVIITII